MERTFYKNPGRFCAQTCMKIALKHFFKNKDFSLQNLAKLSYKKKRGDTNSLGIVFALDKSGLKTKLYTQEINSLRGINKIIHKKLVKKLKNKRLIILKKLKLSELKTFVTKKYLVIVLLNWKTIKNKNGFQGHYVILNEIGTKKLSVINVGHAEASANYLISLKKFNKARHSKGTDSDVIVIYGKKC